MKLVVPSKGARNSNCCYFGEGKGWESGAGGSRKHLCIRVGRGAGAGGHVLSPRWGDRWLPWGGAGQARASLEGTIVLANEGWLPSKGGPICFPCCQQQPREFPPPTKPHGTCVGMLSLSVVVVVVVWGCSSEAPTTPGS